MKASPPAFLAIVLAKIACLWLVGCGGENAANSDGDMLANPMFESGIDGKVVSWAFNQHAGEPSYSFVVEGDALVIERIGGERWGQAIQTLPADHLRGKTLSFSAEISAELDDRSGAPTSPTGVGVRISGIRPGMPPSLGASIISTFSGQPEIGVGNHDWTVQQVIFSVPQSATEIQLSLRLTLDGQLRVRNPRLAEVAAGGG